MDKKGLWAIMLKNSVCVICWAALAIIFNKWWIALFGLLFMTSYETVRKYYRICDRCGKQSPWADKYNDALDKAKAAGWLHVVEGNKDYCPECRVFMNNLEV